MKKPNAAKKTVSCCLAFVMIAAVITGFLLLEPCVKIHGFVPLSPARLTAGNASTTVTDGGGNPVPDSFVLGGKIFAPLSSLPQHTVDAFVSVEDTRFFSHNGLDYYRIAGSALRNIRRGGFAEGASTITQQLVKNTHLQPDKNLRRKVNEVRIATAVERRYSKNEILEMYLNAINFGGGAVGIGAAARLYFDKNAAQLSLNESALLAGVINNPSRYSPIYSAAQCNKRRKLVLSRMRKYGRITAQQYEENLPASPPIKSVVFDQYANFLVSDACAALGLTKSEFLARGYTVSSYLDTDLQGKISRLLAEYEFNGKAGAIVHAVVMNTRGDVLANASFAKAEDIDYSTIPAESDFAQAGGISESHGGFGDGGFGDGGYEDDGFGDGDNYIIESSLSPFFDGSKGIFGLDSADVGRNSIGGIGRNSIEGIGQSSNGVRWNSIESVGRNSIGNVGQNSINSAVQDSDAEESTQNSNQKAKYNGDSNGGNLSEMYRQPGSVIKPAICYAPAMEKKLIVPLTPILDSPVDYGGYAPQNLKGDLGWISAAQALMLSQNTPAVKLLDMCGVDYAKGVAQRLGFEFSDGDNHLALALGGMERGAKLTQIAGAYQAFAGGGLYIKGSHIRTIADADGRVVYRRSHTPVRAVSAETAYFINRILTDCAREGTARRLGRGAAKTGTVGDKSGNTDAYTVAYNSDYVVAVWIGRTKGLLPNTVNGATHPCVLAGQIMDFLPAGAEFTRPETIVDIDLDKTEYFENHRLVQASPDTKKKDRLTGSFCRDNLPAFHVQKSKFILQMDSTCFDKDWTGAAG